MPLPLTMAAMFNLPGNPAGFAQYGRFDNPTWDAVEEMLSHLEDAPAVAFPSGMAAISAVFFSQLKSGDRILLPSDGYYTTRVLAERFLKPLGVSFDLRATDAYLDGGFAGYRLVFVETPANPGLDICDIAAVVGSRACRGRDRRCRQHDHDALWPAAARPRCGYRGGRRHQGAQRPFRCAFRACREPRREGDRGGEGMAKTFRRNSRPIRGMAGASRTGDAGSSLRPHVLVGGNNRAAVEVSSEGAGAAFPRPRGRPVTQSRARADGTVRLPDRADAGIRGMRRKASSTAAP